MRKLELGSGNRPRPGYEHLDIDPACPDLQYCCSFDKIPVKANTFDELLSVHSIEHASWRTIKATLKEWHRVLKPGGKLHIECPNLRWICEAYLKNGSEWQADSKNLHKDERKHLKVQNFYSHTMWANFKLFSSTANGDVHLAAYDAHVLRSLLLEAGFGHVDLLSDDSTLTVEAYK